MNIKHRINKLAAKLMPATKFCICPGVSSLDINDDYTITIIETCEQCGKKVEPFDWVEMTRQIKQVDYDEIGDSKEYPYKNLTDE